MSNVTVIIKDAAGVVVGQMTEFDRQFKTGSRGFNFSGKVVIDGKRYQVGFNLIEVGSKNAAQSAVIAAPTAQTAEVKPAMPAMPAVTLSALEHKAAVEASVPEELRPAFALKCRELGLETLSRMIRFGKQTMKAEVA